MPRLIVTEAVVRGLERCRRSLIDKNPEAAGRAGSTIERHFSLLESSPEIGRIFPEMSEFRELTIAFGDTGYAVLYRHEPNEDVVYILAFGHQREEGY